LKAGWIAINAILNAIWITTCAMYAVMTWAAACDTTWVVTIWLRDWNAALVTTRAMTWAANLIAMWVVAKVSKDSLSVALLVLRRWL